MDDARFEVRLGAAVAAGWRTVLVGVLWLIIGWLFWLAVLVNPACARLTECAWGGISVEQMQPFVWVFFGVFKAILFVLVLVVIFLTIWRRRLKAS